jgi:hypothetical protein
MDPVPEDEGTDPVEPVEPVEDDDEPDDGDLDDVGTLDEGEPEPDPEPDPEGDPEGDPVCDAWAGMVEVPDGDGCVLRVELSQVGAEWATVGALFACAVLVALFGTFVGQLARR